MEVLQHGRLARVRAIHGDSDDTFLLAAFQKASIIPALEEPLHRLNSASSPDAASGRK
jgi:hypothetical protein